MHGPELEAATILVVDDDRAVRYTLRSILQDEGFDVHECASGAEALAFVRERPVDLVVTDLRMPGLDGFALLERLRSRAEPVAVVMVTAHGDERTAVEAMKRGAADYFRKPFQNDEIVRVVRRQLESVGVRAENRRLRAEMLLRRTMVFESAPMQRVAQLVQRAAGRDVTVLITGESGTGKELVAQALVEGSARAKGPFVSFNCGALPRELAEAELFGHSRGAFTHASQARRGLFREAHGGTILLDEVAELDPQTQTALLRVLQEREVRPLGQDRPERIDVRVLAACNVDLRQAVDAGRFRADLYYRLNVVTIHVPPLRERRDDILPLAHTFLRRAAQRFGLGPLRMSPALEAELVARPWPGNVRELEHAIESWAALADGTIITGEDEPEAAPAREENLGLREMVAAYERGLIEAALTAAQGNQSEAARQLGIGRVTLFDKMKRFGLRGRA
jgi:two-component system response regulator HydG